MKTYIAEFVGTLVFLTIILKSGGSGWKVAAGLLGAVLLMGDVSGHFNPAVTFMEFMNGTYAADTSVPLYMVMSQLLGGVAALHLKNLA
jgi:glycerol uptake facilitator-like aquaporin